MGTVGRSGTMILGCMPEVPAPAARWAATNSAKTSGVYLVAVLVGGLRGRHGQAERGLMCVTGTQVPKPVHRVLEQLPGHRAGRLDVQLPNALRKHRRRPLRPQSDVEPLQAWACPAAPVGSSAPWRAVISTDEGTWRVAQIKTVICHVTPSTRGLRAPAAPAYSVLIERCLSISLPSGPSTQPVPRYKSDLTCSIAVRAPGLQTHDLVVRDPAAPDRPPERRRSASAAGLTRKSP